MYSFSSTKIDGVSKCTNDFSQKNILIKRRKKKLSLWILIIMRLMWRNADIQWVKKKCNVKITTVHVKLLINWQSFHFAMRIPLRFLSSLSSFSFTFHIFADKDCLWSIANNQNDLYIMFHFHKAHTTRLLIMAAATSDH